MTDGTHHSPSNSSSGEFAYITAKNIKWHGLDLRDLTYVSGEEHATIYRRCPVLAGDVLLIKDGATTGVATINDLDEPFSMLSSVALLRPVADLLDSRFLWRWLKSESAQSALLGAMSGSAIRRLTLTKISQTDVPIPPMAEQRRIVAKLNALTARLARARAELDRVPMLAEKLRHWALRDAENGKLSESWRLAAAAKPGASVSQMLQSLRVERSHRGRQGKRTPTEMELPELPASWLAISPDELASDDRYSIGIGPFGSNLVKGDYRSEGTRLIFVRDIRIQRFDSKAAKFVDDRKANELAPHSVKCGDVLITKMGDPPGDSALYDGPDGAIITADCIKLRVHPALADPRFVAYAIRFPSVQRQILAATKGVAQQKISLDTFRRIALPVPPVREQMEIVRLIETAFARADRLDAEAARVRALLDRLDSALLARAFRGELVPQDPNDEPASILLDRIRTQRAAAPKAKRGRKAKA